MDQSIINFKVYEDSVEYVGMAQATLPDLTALTQSISGAGIAGNVLRWRKTIRPPFPTGCRCPCRPCASGSRSVTSL